MAATSTATLLNPLGELVNVPAEQVTAALSQGYAQPTADELAALEQRKIVAAERKAKEERNAGVGNAILAASTKAAETMLPGSVRLAHEYGYGISPEDYAELQEARPVASAIGTVGGIALPAMATMGAGAAAPAAAGVAKATLPALASRAGAAVEGALIKKLGTGFGAKVGAMAARGAVEGTAFEAGNLVSEAVTLQDPKLSAEQIIAHPDVAGRYAVDRLLEGAALGGLAGGGLQLGGSAVVTASKKALGVARKALAKLEAVPAAESAAAKAVTEGAAKPAANEAVETAASRLEEASKVAREEAIPRHLAAMDQAVDPNAAREQVAIVAKRLEELKAKASPAEANTVAAVEEELFGPEMFADFDAATGRSAIYEEQRAIANAKRANAEVAAKRAAEQTPEPAKHTTAEIQKAKDFLDDSPKSKLGEDRLWPKKDPIAIAQILEDTNSKAAVTKIPHELHVAESKADPKKVLSTVKFDDLVFMQPEVSHSIMMDKVATSGGNQIPVIARLNGKMYVRDGSHVAIARKLLGENELLVNVKDYDGNFVSSLAKKTAPVDEALDFNMVDFGTQTAPGQEVATRAYYGAPVRFTDGRGNVTVYKNIAEAAERTGEKPYHIKAAAQGFKKSSGRWEFVEPPREIDELHPRGAPSELFDRLRKAQMAAKFGEAPADAPVVRALSEEIDAAIQSPVWKEQGDVIGRLAQAEDEMRAARLAASAPVPVPEAASAFKVAADKVATVLDEVIAKAPAAIEEHAKALGEDIGKRVSEKAIGAVLGAVGLGTGGPLGAVAGFAAERLAGALLPKSTRVLAHIKQIGDWSENAIKSAMPAIVEGFKRGIPKVTADVVASHGDFDNRREALAAMRSIDTANERVAALAADWAEHAPSTANGSQVVAARAISFLQSKLPKPPPTSLMESAASSRPVYSSADVAKFTRYYEAIKDPYSILENAKRGALSREEVEAVSAVYPSLFARMQSALIEHIAQQKGGIPQRQRQTIELMLGTKVSEIRNSKNLQTVYSVNRAQQKAKAATPSKASAIQVASRTALHGEKEQ